MTEQALPQCTVTIMEAATVIAGADTVYRYDRAGPLLTAPWARVAVVEQVRQLYALDFPHLTVVVHLSWQLDAAEVQALLLAFRDAGVDATANEDPHAPQPAPAAETGPADALLSRATPALPEGTVPEPPATPHEQDGQYREREPEAQGLNAGELDDAGYGGSGPYGDNPYGDDPYGDNPYGDGPYSGGLYGDALYGDGGGDDDGYEDIDSTMRLYRPDRRPSRTRGRVTPIHLAIAAVVVAVVGLSWFSLDNTVAPPALMSQTEHEEPAQDHAAPSSTPPETPAVQENQQHEAGVMQVSTPAGFHASALDANGFILTGADADLRIHVAADPIYSVAPASVVQEVAAMVEEDPTLTRIDAPATPDERMRYRETPGDGSEVEWTTWISQGYHVSVGCQTRQQATVAQRAACRVAVDSAEVRTPAGQAG
ncbi:type VII secretion-associated protein [Corynebacterium uberis]|uniref:type VII secretion-associated protein n=1 Tax=Corynebacterium uberis TaxID=2883169 RepID=UPI001D0A93D4|nr:type VII secretion-associated protein [Corynebacterium uberis]UDL72912.1 type VII secretion-associated protein [Corynebacterium uberis]